MQPEGSCFCARFCLQVNLLQSHFLICFVSFTTCITKEGRFVFVQLLLEAKLHFSHSSPTLLFLACIVGSHIFVLMLFFFPFPPQLSQYLLPVVLPLPLSKEISALTRASTQHRSHTAGCAHTDVPAPVLYCPVSCDTALIRLGRSALQVTPLFAPASSAVIGVICFFSHTFLFLFCWLVP